MTYPTTIPLLSVAGDPPNRQMPATLSGMGQWGWYQRVLQRWRTSEKMMKKDKQRANGATVRPELLAEISLPPRMRCGEQLFTKAKEEDDKDKQPWKPAV